MSISMIGLSLAHDMSGLCSARSVRFMLASLEVLDAPVGSPSGCARGQVPGYLGSL